MTHLRRSSRLARSMRAWPQQRGRFDHGRRPLGLLHRARRRRCARRARRLYLRPLHRALSRRSGGSQPAVPERGLDREGAWRNSLRVGVRGMVRQKDERQTAAARARWHLCRLHPARLHNELCGPRLCRGRPDRAWCGRLFPIDRAGQTAFRAREPLHDQSRHRRPARELVASGRRSGRSSSAR